MPLTAHPPKAACLSPVASLKKGKLVAVADHETVRSIKVRKPARSRQRAFVVKRSIQSGVAGGRSVRRFRKGIRSLEISRAPAPRKRGLQRMVVRVGIVGKNLHAVVVVDPRISRPCRPVGDGAFRDGVWRAILRGNGQRISRSGQVVLRYVRVSRRCTAWVPTYPISKTQLCPSERCTVRFHCCVLGATNFLGTTSPNRSCEGITPGPVPLHA